MQKDKRNQVNSLWRLRNGRQREKGLGGEVYLIASLFIIAPRDLPSSPRFPSFPKDIAPDTTLFDSTLTFPLPVVIS
ncbi:uncharacterized protein CLUP02_12291 [Colletotrichum lupini]|uniref:Uncharacterized protein n=1 Tax=Colletotrichum lupini TaxID=145971 RepID=A0A9Q8T028_9PEZI|nr:uncharacterized protein CLUP02_12291 [Colletotrichum lupini]UQC86789.1 hypothetical protein CLUP02_12291 [Colletotrichum lupini]